MIWSKQDFGGLLRVMEKEDAVRLIQDAAKQVSKVCLGAFSAAQGIVKKESDEDVDSADLFGALLVETAATCCLSAVITYAHLLCRADESGKLRLEEEAGTFLLQVIATVLDMALANKCVTVDDVSDLMEKWKKVRTSRKKVYDVFSGGALLVNLFSGERKR